MHFLITYFYELKHQKLRMFLTIMAVAWGMANIVLMLSVGEGLYTMMSRGLSGMGEGIAVGWPNQTSKASNGYGAGRPVRVTEADIAAAATISSIRNISAEYSGWGVTMRVDGKNISKNVRGVYPVYGSMRNLVPEHGGRFLNDIDEEKRRRVIFLGNEVRDVLFGKDEAAVGKTVSLNGTPFLVVGVLRHKYQMSCYNGNDSGACFVPASTFRTMFNRSHVNIAIIEPKSEAVSKEAQKEFRKLLAGRHGYHPEDDALVSFWDTYETKKMQDVIFRGLQAFLGVIGGLTLLIAGMGVANIMYVTVKERTREIGIKMAVGANPLLIVAQFLVEALITVSLGGLIGTCMAMGLIDLFGLIPLPDSFVEVTGRPEPVFSAMIALICVSALNIIGLFAGIFPARRASLVDPVEALRYE